MISSQSNPIIKKVKKLHSRAGRKKFKQYFIEGIRGVEQVLDNGAPVREALFSRDVLEFAGGEDLIRRLEEKGIPVIEVSREVFDSIADTGSPQYIMAVLDIIQYEIESVISGENILVVIVDGIQDPGNLGTIIRTADAAGADGVILLKGTADLYNPKTVRSTMGSVFSTPIIHADDAASLIELLHRHGVAVVATGLEGSKYYFEVDYTGSTAVVIGSEAHGVSDGIMERCDECVRIPMQGKAESLNAAVASAVVLYKAVEQRLT
ncbi:MAG: rRNA methylase [Firmicutes bacterium]|nr:rRNA methylase [Bacillota bacterium]MDI6706494.1 RNA methyltransferase [Bacillota bacterium]